MTGANIRRFAFAILLAVSLLALASTDARQAYLTKPTILGMQTGDATGHAPRWREVVTVEPGGAAEQAGIAAGDAVRYD